MLTWRAIKGDVPLPATDFENKYYKKCLKIASTVYNADAMDDPTKGSTMYYSPTGMKPYGSTPKDWHFSQ